MTTPQEEVLDLQDLREQFAATFDDHGLTWTRKAGREWSKPGGSGHTLMVTGAVPEAGGFGFMVVRDEDTEIVSTGFGETRGEARRLAVHALGEVLGVVASERSQDALMATNGVAPGSRLKTAARVILGTMAGVALGTFAMGLLLLLFG